MEMPGLNKSSSTPRMYIPKGGQGDQRDYG
jgi:hypothetical protein